MKINIYSIIKPSKDEFDVLIKEFIKMSSKYAKVEVFYIFNKNIAKAQTIGADLPAGFQRAEFLLEKGSIDMVVNRTSMKQTLTHLLSMFKKEKIS